MSVQVANINLSAAVAGNAGQVVSLGTLLPPPTIQQQMRPQDNKNLATLLLFNESGCLLQIVLPESRQTKTLPAGRWLELQIPPHETAVNYLVLGVAGGAPFSNLLADYFAPGEPVDPLGVVGNSPVGVSGNVQTGGATGTAFIKNDANAPATSIIEATPNDQGSSAWSLNNDGSGFWRILSANVLANVVNLVRGTTGAVKAAITIGASGDTSITTFYGTVGAGSVVPGATVNGNIAGQAGSVPVAGIGAGTLPAGVNVPAAQVQAGTFGAGNFTFPSGTGFAGGASFFDGSTGALNLPHSGAILGLTFFSGSGSGTFSHGMNTTPRGIIVCPNTGVDSSYTVGVDHITATNCHVNIGGDQAVALFGVAFV